jgi:hypothetical protein
MTSSAKKTLILALLLNIVAISLYVYLFVDIVNTQKEITISFDEIERHELDRVKLESVRNIIRDTEHDRAIVESYFVRTDGMVAFISNLESLASEAGVNMEINSINENNDYESLQTIGYINIMIVADGLWDNVYRFIAMVENLPLKLDIKEAQIEAKGGIQGPSEGPRRWEASLSVEVGKIN